MPIKMVILTHLMNPFPVAVADAFAYILHLDCIVMTLITLKLR